MGKSLTVAAVVTFVLLVILAIAIPQCHAADAESYTQVSGGAAVWRGDTEVIQLAFNEPAAVLRNARWQEDLTFVNGTSYKGASYPINSILSGMFVDGFGHLDLGLGVSAMFNPAPFNATPFNFALMASYRFQRWPVTLSYRHWSNAGERQPNLGRDMILIGWRFH